MAIVLIVIGLIIMTVFPALNAVRLSSQRNLTQSNMQSLMLATASYVQANGCLPCPTPALVTGANFGHVRGDNNSAPCNGCPSPEGIPPYMSLGIPAATAHDGAGFWITMRVDPALTTAFNVVPPTKTCSCSLTGSTCAPSPNVTGCTCSAPVNNVCAAPVNAGISSLGLCTASLSKLGTAKPISVQTYGGGTQSAAVLFVSHGTHGYGSYIASANTTARNGQSLPFFSFVNCSATGGFAECNASPSSGSFIDAPMSTNAADPYDDVLAYADRNSLISMLGNGSCQTVW